MNPQRIVILLFIVAGFDAASAERLDQSEVCVSGKAAK